MDDATIFVDNYDKKDALKHLKQRMSKGEDVYEILKISPTETYYVDKLLKGYGPMSLLIFNRIMSDTN